MKHYYFKSNVYSLIQNVIYSAMVPIEGCETRKTAVRMLWYMNDRKYNLTQYSSQSLTVCAFILSGLLVYKTYQRKPNIGNK